MARTSLAGSPSARADAASSPTPSAKMVDVTADQRAQAGPRATVGVCVQSVNCDELEDETVSGRTAGTRLSAKSRSPRVRARVVALAGALVAIGVVPSGARRARAGRSRRFELSGEGEPRFRRGSTPRSSTGTCGCGCVSRRARPWSSWTTAALRICASRSGVEVNQNSAMYYLNQTPVAETPPSGLTRRTPPSWQRVSGGHDYGWHDGRLHALATVALSPGVAYVGRWSIPVLVDGRLSSISGGLWHADDPSIVWFWPIVVLLACVLAARRVRRPALDALVARVLASRRWSRSRSPASAASSTGGRPSRSSS